MADLRSIGPRWEEGRSWLYLGSRASLSLRIKCHAARQGGPAARPPLPSQEHFPGGGSGHQTPRTTTCGQQVGTGQRPRGPEDRRALGKTPAPVDLEASPPPPSTRGRVGEGQPGHVVRAGTPTPRGAAQARVAEACAGLHEKGGRVAQLAARRPLLRPGIICPAVPRSSP